MSDATITQRLDVLTEAVKHMARLTGARLTREEVCERLRISRNTLTAYIDKKGFPTPGRDGKWLLEEIVEWETKK